MEKIERLMFVSPKLAGGGAERVVSVLCSSLADLGYYVDLVLYERKTNEYSISNKVHVHVLPKNDKGENRLVYYLKKLLLLRRIIKDNHPDVLIPFLPYQVEHTFFASRGLKIPMVVTVRNNPMYDTKNDKQRKMRDWIALHTEGVFLQTETQKEYFTAKIKEKCFTIANPVNENILNAEYSVRNQIKRIVTVGRLEEQKNFSMLIDAFRIVKNNHQELTLDVYGEGTLRQQLQDQIDTLGLHDSIKLCGRTNDIVDTLTEHYLFIMSSNFEGMPNALMEAMGVGLPCISTDCPTGPRELIGKNERGILVEIGSTDGLVTALNYSIMEPEEMKTKAEAGRQYIRQTFSPDKIARALVDELEKMRSQYTVGKA